VAVGWRSKDRGVGGHAGDHAEHVNQSIKGEENQKMQWFVRCTKNLSSLFIASSSLFFACSSSS
jgi:hypothetical protein